MLTVVAPPLATLAVRFGPPEYTALLILGLIFLAYMSSSSLIRTLLMACLGLLLGMTTPALRMRRACSARHVPNSRSFRRLVG